jgi:hypothetical protein
MTNFKSAGYLGQTWNSHRQEIGKNIGRNKVMGFRMVKKLRNEDLLIINQSPMTIFKIASLVGNIIATKNAKNTGSIRVLCCRRIKKLGILILIKMERILYLVKSWVAEMVKNQTLNRK